MEKLLKTGEAARFLGVSEITVRRMVRRGELVPMWLNGQMRFKEADLRRCLKTEEVAA